ncbi:putative HTH-type transcriptional regulator YxaF [Terricaulis silvestris]|uniref:Putative HTH-type transcriptional regulator YxaF n=2 Tax=Terricaulis silvestris TaxID=2686094 RepID=A0A6I6MKM7_9CAUL|nr:putative HTH-type transcriptional regulator YxaF [Terricaulis silvestris]
MGLIARKGVQGTSFSEVLEAAGAPRGSLYHHFPGGKDELVLAAMDEASRLALGAIERARGQPADKVAESFISFWRTVLTRSGLEAGCALLAVTLGADTAAQRERAGELFKRFRKVLREMLVEGGVPADRAEGLAAGLLSACEGAVAVARAEASIKPFNLVAAEQVRAIRAAMR